MDQQLEVVRLLDYLCENLNIFNRQILEKHLEWIRQQKFQGEEKAYTNYLQQTRCLFEKLRQVKFPLKAKTGHSTVHIKPPLKKDEKIELGEFYFQAGITTPGTLSIKFGKLDEKTQTRCEQPSFVDEKDYEIAFTPKYFKDLRDRSIFGYVLFRILILCSCCPNGEHWTKVPSKNVLVQATHKARLTRSESAPVEPRAINLPKDIRGLNLEHKKALINGLKRETYLIGKDCISFAKKLDVYSDDEIIQFERQADPTKCIIEDLIQTKPNYEVHNLLKILHNMKRNDIVADMCEEYKKKLDSTKSFDHTQLLRQKAHSDPQEPSLLPRIPVEDEDPKSLTTASHISEETDRKEIHPTQEAEAATNDNYSSYCSDNKASNQSSPCETHDPVYPFTQETSGKLDIPAHQNIQKAVPSPLDNPAYSNVQQAVHVSSILPTGIPQAAVPSTLSNPPYPGIQQAVSNAPENVSTNAGEYHNSSQKSARQTIPKELVTQQNMHQSQSPNNRQSGIEESQNTSHNTQQNSENQEESNSNYPDIRGAVNDASRSTPNYATNNSLAAASETTNTEIEKNIQPEGDLSLNSVIK